MNNGALPCGHQFHVPTIECDYRPPQQICIRLVGGPRDGTIAHHVCREPHQLPVGWVEFVNPNNSPFFDVPDCRAMYVPTFDPEGHFYLTPEGEVDFVPGRWKIDDGDGGHDGEHGRCVVYTYDYTFNAATRKRIAS